ncbi:MAG: restriction endonuclease subunit S [Christensenellales bacterium]
MRFPGFDESWKAIKLSDVGEASSGYGFPDAYQGEKTSEIPFFKVSDMNLTTNKRVMQHANNYVSQSTVEKLRVRPYSKDAIIFAKVGAAISHERKRIAISPFLIDNNMMAFTPKRKEDIEFIYHLFQRLRLSKYIQVGALPSYNANDILNICTFYPTSVIERKKIVNILNLIEERIDKQTKIIAALKKYKRGAIRQILLPKSCPLKNAKWTTTRMSELGSFVKGASLSKADISEEGTPFILYGELYTTYNEVITNIKRHTQAKVDELYLSCVGDVVIPTSGETPEEISTASCVMLPGVILAGDLNIFRSSKVDGRIISYLLNHVVNAKIARIAQGKSVVHIQASELGKLTLSYPDENTQRTIIDFLSKLDEKIISEENALTFLTDLKEGLMQQLFI